MSRSPEKWLALDDKLGVELAKVLREKPWKHDLYEGELCTDRNVVCSKCDGVPAEFTGVYVNGVPGRTIYESDELCPVPDPIDTEDWNVAMEWIREYAGKGILLYMKKMFDWSGYELEMTLHYWLISKAQPRHYLIAAAMAKESEDAM